MKFVDKTREFVPNKVIKQHYLYYSNDCCIYQIGSKIIVVSASKKEAFYLESNIFKRVILQSRLFQRLFRIDIRAFSIQKNIFVFAYKKRIYRLDLLTNTLKMVYQQKEGCGSPLYISNIQNSKKYFNGFYFGEYLNNDQRNPVDILFSHDGDSWRTIFTFEKGTINHIHNIVFDAREDRLLVFTGDYYDAANIWLVSPDYSSASPFFADNNHSRACHAFFTESNIFYCTDYPDKLNHLISLNNDEEIEIINGSSIYGASISGCYLFSTCVEPDYNHKNKLGYLLTRKKGDGIIENSSVLYALMHGNLIKIANFSKDVLPFGLFQFGNIMFPIQESEEYFLFFCCSVRKYDGKTVFIKKRQYENYY